MYGYQFRCLIYDKNNQETITDTASLNLYTPYLQCVDNQTVTLDSGNSYTVVGNEFDARVFNKCHENLTLINDYNNTETLAGATFPIGTHTVTWYLKDDQNQTIDSCSFDVTVSTPEAINSVADFGVKVYPNPTNALINVEKANGYNCEIIDINGRVIKSYENVNSDNLQIDLSNQAKGMYILKIYNDKVVKNVKIIVE